MKKNRRWLGYFPLVLATLLNFTLGTNITLNVKEIDSLGNLYENLYSFGLVTNNTDKDDVIEFNLLKSTELLDKKINITRFKGTVIIKAAENFSTSLVFTNALDNYFLVEGEGTLVLKNLQLANSDKGNFPDSYFCAIGNVTISLLNCSFQNLYAYSSSFELRNNSSLFIVECVIGLGSTDDHLIGKNNNTFIYLMQEFASLRISKSSAIAKPSLNSYFFKNLISIFACGEIFIDHFSMQYADLDNFFLLRIETKEMLVNLPNFLVIELYNFSLAKNNVKNSIFITVKFVNLILIIRDLIIEATIFSNSGFLNLEKVYGNIHFENLKIIQNYFYKNGSEYITFLKETEALTNFSLTNILIFDNLFENHTFLESFSNLEAKSYLLITGIVSNRNKLINSNTENNFFCLQNKEYVLIYDSFFGQQTMLNTGSLILITSSKLSQENVTLDVINNVFMDNFLYTAKEKGSGTFYIKNILCVRITNNVFYRISLPNEGSAGFTLIGNSYASGVFYGNIFMQNKATNGSYSFNIEKCYLVIYGLIIFECYSDFGSGMIGKDLNLLISSSVFVKNFGYTSAFMKLEMSKYLLISLFNTFIFLNFGGLSCWYSDSALLKVINLHNSYFLKNEANMLGGVYTSYNLYSNEENLFQNCLFYKNKGKKGGLIRIFNYFGIASLYNCLILTNSAIEQGGVFFLYSWMTIFSERTLYFNNTAGKGGIFFLYGCGFIGMDDIFQGNKAVNASVLLTGSEAYVELKNTKILNSKALNSHTILLSEISKAVFINIYLANCSSGVKGSGLTIFSRKNVTVNSMICINASSPHGACLYISYNSQEIKIEFMIIVGSQASLYLNSARIKFYNITISNVSEEIFNIKHTAFSIDNLYIHNITSKKGSKRGLLISMQESNLTVYQLALTVYFGPDLDFSIIDSQYNSSLIIKRLDVSNFPFNKFFFVESSSLAIESCITKMTRGYFIRAVFSNISILNCFVFGSNSTRFLEASNSNITVNQSLITHFNDSSIVLSSENSQNVNSKIFLTFFFKNKSPFGSCLCFKSGILEVYKSIFVDNFAQYKGGALVFICKDSSICDYKIYDNFFALCRAVILGGGAIYWEEMGPSTLFNNSFINNSAIYGNNIASEPLYIYSDMMNQLTGFTSGESLKSPLFFFIKDFYNQTVSTNERNQAKLYLSNKNQLPNESYLSKNNNFTACVGDNNINFEGGIFSFVDLKFVSLPESTRTLVVETSAIKKLKPNLLKGIPVKEWEYGVKENLYYFSIDIKFGPCLAGQIYLSLKNICENCSEFFYAFSPKEPDTQCQPCPKNAICPGGIGNQIILSQGYWRETLDSPNLYRCNKQYACPGGAKPFICEEGYENVLCDSCKKELDGLFFLDLDKKCKICSASQYIRSLIVLSLIFLILCVYTVLLIRFELTERDAPSTILLKILNHNVQVLMLILDIQAGLLIDISQVLNIHKGFDNPSIIFNGLECFMSSFLPDLNIFFKKLIFGGLITITIPVLVPVLWILIFKFYKLNSSACEGVSRLRVNITTSLIIIFYAFQPSFINLLIQGLTCRKIEEIPYLTAHLSQRCWNQSHYQIIIFIICPLLSVWMFALPIYLLRNLFKNMRRNVSIISFSYVVTGYRKAFFFWDFIMMIEKYILIFAATFIENEFLVVFVFVLVSFFHMTLQLLLKPFRKADINKVATKSFFASYITISAASILFFVDSNRVVIYLIVSLVSLVNLCFYGSWTAAFVRNDKFLRKLWERAILLFRKGSKISNRGKPKLSQQFSIVTQQIIT